MNIKDLVQQIRNTIHPPEPLTDQAVQGFLRILDEVRTEDVPCSEVFSRLDEYVEKEFHGEDVSQLMPLLKEHLDICQDCCDEYEALLNVIDKTGEKQ